MVMTPGLQWVSLMLLTRIGWAGRHWALPFLTALVVSARYDRRKGIIRTRRGGYKAGSCGTGMEGQATGNPATQWKPRFDGFPDR